MDLWLGRGPGLHTLRFLNFKKQALEGIRRSLLFWEGVGKGTPGEATKGPRPFQVGKWAGPGH